jgi:FtsP/CotA-like multicopper oxidase with cupredoxin domain
MDYSKMEPTGLMGLLVSLPRPSMDACLPASGVTQCGIPVGQSLVYNFTIEKQFGTYWYHSHYGTQYLDGILGPLVVHAPEEMGARWLYDQERVVLVQDWYHDFSTVNLGNYLVPDNENSEPLPDNGLINGFN